MILSSPADAAITSAKAIRESQTWAIARRTPLMYKLVIHANATLNGWNSRGSWCVGLSRIAHRAGVSVSAITPDMLTAVATVTANCLYNWPASPPRNATGTNTASKTSSMAMIAVVTSDIDSNAAARGVRPRSAMRRSTFSSTTMASSTTIPVASTIANRVSVLMEKPNRNRPAKAPIRDTGTAMNGISAARQLCRNTNTTISTSAAASSSVWMTSLIDASTTRVVSYGNR